MACGKAGLEPWATVLEAGRRPPRVEVTAWSKASRTLLFVVQNVPVSGSSAGGGGAEGLHRRTADVTVVFRKAVSDLRDERTGRQLGDGREFHFRFDTAEALFVSFAGSPPRK